MGDQNQGALIAFKPSFQPDHRIEIEVVRRFIEQQQVRTANQRLREVKAHAPAAGKVAYRAFELFITKAQAVQQAGGARADCPRVDRVQFAVYGGDGVPVVTFIGVVELGFQLTELTVAVNHIVQRRFGEGRRFLIHPRQLPVTGIGKVAAVGANLVF